MRSAVSGTGAGGDSMNRLRVIIPPVVTFIAVILVWAGLKRFFGISDFTLPSPMQVVASFVRYAGPLLRATLTTSESALAGFTLSIIVGILAGIVLSSGK